MHSRKIADYGGVVNTMPKFAAFFMLFAMANAGLPGTSGFIGEFMVVLRCHPVQLLGRLCRRDHADHRRRLRPVDVQAGGIRRCGERPCRRARRHRGREFAFLAVLAICVLAMGLYPKPITDVLHPLLTTAASRGVSKL